MSYNELVHEYEVYVPSLFTVAKGYLATINLKLNK
uniref:Uncharacterized protein n=1 Tax=Anguilla anguilla TaxID=7936 RepID=A0A0E9QW72_ANGAN